MKKFFFIFLTLSIFISVNLCNLYSETSIVKRKDSYYWYNEAKYYTIYKKDYNEALHCVNMSLKLYPYNKRAKTLKKWLTDKMGAAKKKEEEIKKKLKEKIKKEKVLEKLKKTVVADDNTHKISNKKYAISDIQIEKMKRDIHLRIGEDCLARRDYKKANEEFILDLKKNPNRIKSMFYIAKHYIDNGDWLNGVILLNRIMDKLNNGGEVTPEFKEVMAYQLKMYEKALFIDKGIKSLNRDIITKKMAKQSYDWKDILTDLPKTSEILIELNTLDKIDIKLLKKKKKIPAKMDVNARDFYLDRDGKIYPITNFFREKQDIILPNMSHNYKIKKDSSKLIEQGDYYSSIGSYDRALKFYRDAKRIDPTSSLARNNIGVIYKIKGRINEAITEFKAAIALEPSYSEPLNNLGIIYSEIGELNEAIKLFKISEKLDRQDARIQYNLGLVYEKKKNIKKAIEYYKNALKIKPVYEAALYRIGKIYLKKNSKREALKYFRRLQKIIPRESSRYKELMRLLNALED